MRRDRQPLLLDLLLNQERPARPARVALLSREPALCEACQEAHDVRAWAVREPAPCEACGALTPLVAIAPPSEA